MLEIGDHEKKNNRSSNKKEPVSDLCDTYSLVEIIAINTLISTEITTNCDKTMK